MIEKQLDDNEFRHWLASPGSPRVNHGIFSSTVLPWPESQLLQQLGGFSLRPMPQREAKPAAFKKRWSVFDSTHLAIAVNINGTVVVRARTSSKFKLWIRKKGDVGTNARNEIEPSSIADERFIRILDEVVDQIRVWADQKEGRKIPQGPVRLLERARKCLNWRLSLFREDETAGGFFFKSGPADWTT